ncbi:hypothetical protein GW932_03325 [archaeon]|nr:hypothetical protein [archaeon]
MKKEILNFIRENNLSPFNQLKTQLKPNDSIYKTTDAKKIHTKTINKISENFIFKDTSNILQFFSFTNKVEEIKKRQEFFNKIKSSEKLNNFFLKEIKKPKKWWKPEYDVVVVTEEANTFNKLKEMNCPVQLIISEQDVILLESKDLVQIIDCPEFGIALESLPQGIFYKNIEEIYLERHLETFSGWIEIINLFNENNSINEIKNLVSELTPLIKLTKNKESEIIDANTIEKRILEANEKISEKLKELTLSGTELMQILSKGILPTEIKKLIEEILVEFEIPRRVVEIQIPLKTNEEELERLILEQSKDEYSNLAEKIKEYSIELKNIPNRLKEFEELILYFDFISGVQSFLENEINFPEINEELILENVVNLLIEKPKPISFNLSTDSRCSILTGANSGGKTTLIEHVLQLVSITQLGLASRGKIKMPLFEEVYYFAKNKGSASKGAFETLLTQMSEIKPGNKTLILADEIEAVTEPGVAGNIIAATAEFFLEKNCYLIVATHLGHEIEKILPKKARIDGIEAKGLTENFELIVDHNPVLGRLAHSTPELIVEKMANVEKKEYFNFLNNFLKNKD